MTKISIAFVATLSLVAFTGCKKKGGDCEGAMTHAADVAKSDPNMKGMDAATMDKMKAVSLSHCKDDKWDADVIKCFNEAKDTTGLQACSAKLKPEQSEKFNKAMMEAAMPAAGSDHMGGSMGSDTAGSAMAGSGSAAPAAGSDMGSGSAMAGSGSAAAPAAGSDGSAAGSAMAPPAGSGSAMGSAK